VTTGHKHYPRVVVFRSFDVW